MHPSAACGDTHSSVTFHLAFNDRGEGVINAQGCRVRGFFCEGAIVFARGVFVRGRYICRAALLRVGADKNDTGGG